MAERCPNNIPVRLGPGRYVWRPCLFGDRHDGLCEVDRNPEPDDSRSTDG
jgi:hypothetical protein